MPKISPFPYQFLKQPWPWNSTLFRRCVLQVLRSEFEALSLRFGRASFGASSNRRNWFSTSIALGVWKVNLGYCSARRGCAKRIDSFWRPYINEKAIKQALLLANPSHAAYWRITVDCSSGLRQVHLSHHHLE